MALETKVLKIGDSLGIFLSEEALRALKVTGGDKIFLTEAPGLDGKLQLADDLMNRYQNAFKELAK